MNKSKILWAALGVVLIAGLIWLIASAPKTQAPASPSGVPAPQGGDGVLNGPATGGSQPSTGSAPAGGTSKTISLYLVTPKGGERWLLGDNHTISWTNPAKITGEVILIQAETGKVMGWIDSTTGPDQTSFAWDTHYVATTRNGALRQEVAPGNYKIQVKFDSAKYPVLTSGAFAITVTTPAAETRTVLIQNYAFGPMNTTIHQGGKVTFTNNDTVTHDVAFQTSVYAISHIPPGTSVIIDTTVFPLGTYNYYCDIHPTMKGTLTIQ